MKKIFEKAHQLTKEMKERYPEVDYQAQFGLYISFLLEEEKEEKEVENKNGYGGRVRLGETSLTASGRLGYEKKLEGFSKIVRETEKAILFQFTGTVTHFPGDEYEEVEEVEETVWIPKSQSEVGKEFLYFASWLQKKNRILKDLQIYSSFHDGEEIFSN